MRRVILAALVAATGSACAPDIRDEVDAYLSAYADTFQHLDYEASEAEWASNTRIVEGDTTNAARTRQAKEALAAFVGSVENIERIRGYLERRDRLTPLQVRQLEVMLYEAADQPQTIPDVVAARIAAETDQVERLYGFEFRLRDRPVTPNEIDAILRSSRDLAERRAAWEVSKQVGPALKPGLVRLRDLRNETARALGYPDFFAYQVSSYGMTTQEMLRLTDTLLAQLRPLYREIHTWARHELAERFGVPVPELLPAHWLPNRWAQDWSALVTVEGLSADSAIGRHTAEWVVRQAEDFYLSLGFDSLPATFWERSSLYPLPADAPYKKNTHASAWHVDLEDDVRSLMSVEPDPYWYETAHHELGHVYYFRSYSRPEVPIVLREGANRAYHEAIGSLMGLASLQGRFLANRGLVRADAEVDRMAQLLQEALNYAVFIPFSAGTMTRFEHALYAEELPPDRFNAKWWELVRRYQGVTPPAPRGEEYADALTKTHINDDPGQYYDYALSFALLFQMHDHIATEILGQDPHDTDYYGNAGVGDFLRRLMAPGASRPWRDVLRETTGRELDAQAMVEYFQPLYEWLQQQNDGRRHTLPDLGAPAVTASPGDGRRPHAEGGALGRAASRVARGIAPSVASAAEIANEAEESPMRVYLVRHGEAKSDQEDPARPLTEAGAATVRRVAGFLNASGAVSVTEIRHSTKLRAKETAEQFARALGLTAPIREVPHLEPLDDASVIAAALDAETRDLAIVGHMPHLSRLASWLTFGDATLEAFDFPPAGVLCLERTNASGRDPQGPGRWSVAWMMVPALLPADDAR